MGVVGFLDDFIKHLQAARRSGLRSKAKMVGQTVIALVFGWLAISGFLEDGNGISPASRHLSFIRDTRFTLPAIVAILLFWVMVTGTSNAVNLTDGLDGLATGACVMVFGAFMFVNIWQNNQNCAIHHVRACYQVRDPLDLALVAAAITGACFGFLWWNAPPAQIFMGDTGSLALGGAMAGFAILTRTELLLLIIGGLFVVITLSVMLQVELLQGVSQVLPRADRVPGRTRSPRLPDGAAPAPLRAARLGAGHRRDPLLDHHRAVRRRRARGLLRRLGRQGVSTREPVSQRTSRRSGVTTTGPACGPWWPGSGSAASPPPTTSPTSAPRWSRSTRWREGKEDQAELLGVLGADVRLGQGTTATPARRRGAAGGLARAGSRPPR